jgi:hypothetical protein
MHDCEYVCLQHATLACMGTSHKTSSALTHGCTLTSNTHTHAHAHLQMATPTCAGAAALVRQYFREGWHVAGVKDTAKGMTPSAALVKAVMIHSGRRMDYQTAQGSWVTPASLPHMSQGFGRVDLSSVLYFGGTKALFVRDRRTVAAGATITECFEVRAGTAFKVSLVWTDPTGVLYVSSCDASLL